MKLRQHLTELVLRWPRWIVTHVLIDGEATPHRMRTAGNGCSVRLHAGTTRQAAVPLQEYPGIITGADAGEHGGRPELRVCQ